MNVAALEEKLAQYDSREDWYLGKPSIERPLEIMDRDSPELKVRKILTNSSLEIRKMLALIYLFSTFILQIPALQVDLDPPFPGADQPCYQEVRK